MSYDLKVKTGTIPQYKIVRESSLKYQTVETAIAGPETAANILRDIIGEVDREYAVVLYLNRKNKVMGYEIVSVGTATGCLMGVSEVFRGALLHGATGIIIGHNHPSGDPKPSQDDIKVTKALLDASKIIGIDILDHIVVGDNCYKSIRESFSHMWV